MPPASSSPTSTFLPDFCQWQMLFSALMISQLLAILLVLAPMEVAQYKLEILWHVSLFTLGVTLCSGMLLCLLRNWLERRNKIFAVLFSYMLILLITALFTHIAWYFFVNPVISSVKNPMPGSEQQFIMPAMKLRITGEGLINVVPIRYHLFMFRNLAISAIVTLVALRYFYLIYHWRLTTEAEAEFRVQALQARIHPHFLFNSMNTIASLTRFDPDLAEQAVEDLSELFRATLSDAKKRVTLEDELQLCQRYLRIEGLRMGNRLQVEWHMETIPKDALLPKLSLQPLLENAIYYGIQPLPEGGLIQVVGMSDEHDIKIDIENPLPPPDMPVPQKGKGNRIALENLRQRLNVYYGRQGHLDIQNDERSYRVSLRFPYERAE
ncbi:histidine kinase [Candidatus Venteria ishoeyi]|uniref:sensor histidine kinase n=1 Tax=Candidatus Venteria ishoeyi TaxID=1899563 RepID=UPI0025A5D762|nr:histidine kinase [Candidatus Venteria ishoeyi]MDM8546643.1 histidine kinase [Candidatus Venteria ishoeyi]